MAHLLKASPASSLTSGILLALLLGMGLAFSRTVRIYTLLSLPSAFTSKGRYALSLLVMVFILAGPVKNFEKNELALSAALTCGQDMIGNITKAALKQAASPAVGEANVLFLPRVFTWYSVVFQRSTKSVTRFIAVVFIQQC